MIGRTGLCALSGPRKRQDEQSEIFYKEFVMTSLRKFIVPAMLGAAVAIGGWGCAAEHPSLVPAEAQVVSSGQGQLSYSAPHDGMVYVYNSSSNKLLYAGPIKQGQSVIVDPASNRIMLNGRVVMNKELGSGTVKVYFERKDVDSMSGDSGSVDVHRQTTETRTESNHSD
jgi:hypothetical protein